MPFLNQSVFRSSLVHLEAFSGSACPHVPHRSSTRSSFCSPSLRGSAIPMDGSRQQPARLTNVCPFFVRRPSAPSWPSVLMLSKGDSARAVDIACLGKASCWFNGPGPSGNTTKLKSNLQDSHRKICLTAGLLGNYACGRTSDGKV